MAKQRKPVVGCKCIQGVNKSLLSDNTKLALGFAMDVVRKRINTVLIVATEKADPKQRGRAVTVLAKYCPFCGKRMPGMEKD